jgi:hypothetical protein
LNEEAAGHYGADIAAHLHGHVHFQSHCTSLIHTWPHLQLLPTDGVYVLLVLCVQEEQLLHNLSAVLQRMRVAASVSEARDLALQLRRMCAAVRASLETHVR